MPRSHDLPAPAGRTYRLCFVCSGNICRSPIAAVVMRHLVDEAGLGGAIEVDSAGMGEWHAGEGADARAVAVLHSSGYDGSVASSSSGGELLAASADVPDGGGLVLAGQHVVLTRSGDEVNAFSATCTHQGCTVDGVTDGRITCPGHGSAFDAATGKVVQGPATTGLAVVEVTLTGDVVLPGGAT